MKRQLLFFLCLLWGWRLSAQQAFEPALQAAAAGAYTRAIGLLQAYIDANPGRRYEDAHAWWLIGQYELALGDVAAAELANEASRRLRARILSDEIAENQVLAARIDIARARYERALRALDEAASLPMEDYRLLASLYLYRGLALAGRQQWAEAEQSFHYARETLRLVAGDGSPELADYYRQQLACWPCAAAADRARLWAAASELLPAETQPLLRARLLRALAACGDTEENAAEALALLRRAGGAGLQEEAALRLDYARLLRDTAAALAQLDTARQLLWLSAEKDYQLSVNASIADRSLMAQLLALQAQWLGASEETEALYAAVRAAGISADFYLSNQLLGLPPAASMPECFEAGMAAAARLQSLHGDARLLSDAFWQGEQARWLQNTPPAAAGPEAAAMLKAEQQWALTPADSTAAAIAAAANSAWQQAYRGENKMPSKNEWLLRRLLNRRTVVVAYYTGKAHTYAFCRSRKRLELLLLPAVLPTSSDAASLYAMLLAPFNLGNKDLLLLPDANGRALDWTAIVRAGGHRRPPVVAASLMAGLAEKY